MGSSVHEGHRKRIMERLQTGAETLQDHELLEILLFNALPRRNTNPIAHNLLRAFGTLLGVLHANVEQLVEVEGVGVSTAEYLRCLGLVFDKIDPKEEELPRCANVWQLGDFLEKHFRGLEDEFLEFYCLNQGEKIYFSKSYTIGRSDKVQLEPSEVSRIFVTQSPYAIIVAHNHPHQRCRPSPADDVFTMQIQALCSLNNVKLHDHFIYGVDGCFSYYATGRMEKIKKKCDMNKLLDGDLS